MTIPFKGNLTHELGKFSSLYRKGGVWSQAIGGLVLKQHQKKVVSDDLDLVGFAIGLVNSVLNLPNGQVKFSGGGGGYRHIWAI